ncbi:MAG: SUMF1/EgtB/PvdO family nonheme iron enzyme [Myxococcales bacterium]|nr:SUMF1/EgtB/PvdO family nonheme iron enzyme [Myxococcales bacterium]
MKSSTWSGTGVVRASIATALCVVGVAALLLSIGPRLAHSQSREAASPGRSASAIGAFDGGADERVLRAMDASAYDAVSASPDSAADRAETSLSAAPRASDGCPDDMLAVQGRFCNEVYEPCERWADNDRDQCLAFVQRPHCTGQRVAMSFCMDRYEWPNREGALPSVMVSYVEAEALCASRGRRLCSEDEWTFACSGEELLPYPYGRERSADACTIDLFARAPNKPLLHSSDRATREAEVERTYMATPSGSRPRCVSPFAVHDMTGNVDEWVRSTASWGQPSGLMGGFWGHVRNRCRAVTRSHGPQFRYYQIGFRCCRDRAAARAPTRGAV